MSESAGNKLLNYLVNRHNEKVLDKQCSVPLCMVDLDFFSENWFLVVSCSACGKRFDNAFFEGSLGDFYDRNDARKKAEAIMSSYMYKISVWEYCPFCGKEIDWTKRGPVV